MLPQKKFRIDSPVTACLIALFFIASDPAFASHQKWSDYKQCGQREEIGENFRAAEEYYRKAFQESWSIGSTSNEMAESLVRLATVLVVQGKYEQAEPYYQRLMKLVEQKKKDKTLDDEVLIWMEDLAEDYTTFSKGAHVIPGLQHAIDLRLLMNGEKAPYLEMNLRELVSQFVVANRIAEAEPYSLRLVKIVQRKKNNFKPIFAGDIYMLGMIEYRLCKFTEAESYTRQAMTMYSNCEVPPGPATANCLIQLGNILKWKKDYTHATEAAKRALQIYERNKGKNSLDTVPAREAYAELLASTKKYTESMHEYDALISILLAKQGEVDARLPGDLSRFKDVCTRANNRLKMKEVDRLIASVTAKMKKDKPKKRTNDHR